MFDEIKDLIISLSYSQGLYSRLRCEMEAQDWEPLRVVCEEHGFKDGLDFIMWLEG